MLCFARLVHDRQYTPLGLLANWDTKPTNSQIVANQVDDPAKMVNICPVLGGSGDANSVDTSGPAIGR